MVMVIYSALVRSHQSTSLVASASCVPRGYNTRARPCLKMWRGAHPHAARKKGSFLPRGMTAVFAVAEAPVSVDTLVIPASFVPRVIAGRVRCRAS